MKAYIKPQWGADLPFEVPEEDFLKARPVPLSTAELRTREIEPPNWALCCTRKAGGRRQPKRQVQHQASSTFWEEPAMGPLGPRGPLAQPNKDAEEAFNRALARRRDKQYNGATSKIEARKASPAGNLLNDDYRFWKGYVNSDEGAHCRWCQERCVDREAMLEHHSQGYCKERLLALYKFAKQSRPRACFVCKARTESLHWGVPICNTVGCISRWKFNHLEYLHGLLQYRIWAEDAQDKDPTNGPFASLPEMSEGGSSC